jgi:hypothetical protein
MAVHAGSGNNTWADYPSTATLINASTLENVENALDGAVLSTGSTTTAPYVVESRLSTQYTGLVNGTDYSLVGQMTVPSGGDPHGMWSQPGGAATRYIVTLPLTGRYEIDWTIMSSGIAAGSAYVHKNCPTANTTSAATANTTYSISVGAAGSAAGGTIFNAHCSEVFTAADWLSFGYWQAATWNMLVAGFGGIKTKVVVRYVGPV